MYQVQAVGPAGYASSATGINGAGAVVGNYMLPDGSSRAYLWQGGQVTELEIPPGSAQTWVEAINGSGQSAGYTAAPSGAIWNGAGAFAGAAGAYLMGINESGDVAGMAIGNDGAGYAFVTRNGVLTSLGQPGGGDWSSAYGINATGEAAGTAMTAGGTFEAFQADSGGALQLLDSLGGANSYATAINDSGTVAGHAQTGTGGLAAVIWNGGANPQSLGTLGGVNSYAYAINAAGLVVGSSDLAGSDGSAAFLYDNGWLYDLNGLLAAGSDWQLLAAYGINESGQIVGKGLYKGEEQAFLLTPTAGDSRPADTAQVPEPRTLWLAVPPLLALLALRTRHR